MTALWGVQPLGIFAPKSEVNWSDELSGHVDEVPLEMRGRISGYLDGCPIFLAWMEYTRDVIDDRFGVSGGNAICSDGKYYWRSDTAAYVQEYGIGLPSGAIEEMRGRNWEPPVFSKEEYLSLYEELSSILLTGFCE